MSAGEPLPREVVVRFVRTNVYRNPVLAAQARNVLGAVEREALARLRPAPARRDYLAGHALARTLLAELAGSDPSRLRFRSSPRGRPEIVAPRGARRLRFSLSHADGVALCAVAARCDVGADVESLRNIGPDPLSLAEAVCSVQERDALRAIPAAGRSERLLFIWTLKEAIAKAMGLGFHFPFARISIQWERQGPAAVKVDREAACNASRLRLAWLRLTPHHVAAVAILRATASDIAVALRKMAFCRKTWAQGLAPSALWQPGSLRMPGGAVPSMPDSWSPCSDHRHKAE